MFTSFGQRGLLSSSPSPSYIFSKHLDGIFKPISNKNPHVSEGKFLGILVFNHLPPSDTDWRTNHSTSSSVRKLNRGSCHTPKFAHTISPIQIQIKVQSSKTPSPKTRFKN